MQKINIIAVGTLKYDWQKQAIQEYSKRLQKFCTLKIIECKESNLPYPQNSLKESANIIKLLNSNRSYNILLAVNAIMVDSIELSKIMLNTTMQHDTINFIIGGSNGLHSNILTYINQSISFGKITLPHQLFRIVLIEQIYRGFMIANNTEYHK